MRKKESGTVTLHLPYSIHKSSLYFQCKNCFLPPSNFPFSHREQTQEVNARPGKKVSTGCEASRCVMSVCNLIANRKLITMLHKFHFYVIFFRTWFTKMTGITNPLHDILLWHVWRIFFKIVFWRINIYWLDTRHTVHVLTAAERQNRSGSFENSRIPLCFFWPII